jgi:hypothetical protein
MDIKITSFLLLAIVSTSLFFESCKNSNSKGESNLSQKSNIPQENPATLQESLEYIKSKTNNNSNTKKYEYAGIYRHFEETNLFDYDLSDNSFTYTEIRKNVIEGTQILFRHKVKLCDIIYVNLGGSSEDDEFISIQTGSNINGKLENQKWMDYEIISSDPDEPSRTGKSDMVEMINFHKGYGKKLEKAINHAINLCKQNEKF